MLGNNTLIMDSAEAKSIRLIPPPDLNGNSTVTMNSDEIKSLRLKAPPIVKEKFWPAADLRQDALTGQRITFKKSNYENISGSPYRHLCADPQAYEY